MNSCARRLPRNASTAAPPVSPEVAPMIVAWLSCRSFGLSVKPQQVVPVEAETADWWFGL
jgi:hypothetical protein